MCIIDGESHGSRLSGRGLRRRAVPVWVSYDVGEQALLKGTAVGPADANCYILACLRTLRGVVIDPGTDTREEWMAIVDEALRNGLKVERILNTCLLYTSPSPRDGLLSRMPSSA